MNNIYVYEVPDSCFYCDFFIKENCCCWLIQKDAREYRDDCPLIPLSDRLAEERKRVVQELKSLLYQYVNIDVDVDYEDCKYSTITDYGLKKIIDQIERGE